MPLAFVQRKNASATAGSSLATGNFGTNPVAGNMIEVVIQVQNVTFPITVTSVTDTLGNTYVATPGSPMQQATGGGVNWQFIFYAKNISGGSANSVTANFDQTSSYTTITAKEVSGADTTNPFVTESEASNTGTSISTGTLSLTGLSCFITEIFESDGAGATSTTPTPFTGYTQFMADAIGYLWDGYHITSTDEVAGATCPTSAGWSIIAAAFKAASGGAAFIAPKSLIVKQAVNRASTY